jgi:hypothetical protein
MYNIERLFSELKVTKPILLNPDKDFSVDICHFSNGTSYSITLHPSALNESSSKSSSNKIEEVSEL